MNTTKISLVMTLLAAMGGSAAAQSGTIRGLPAGQAVYANGYYGAAPSYAYAAPQTAYYAPTYPAQQAYYSQGVAVAPSAQAGRVAYYAPPTVAYYAPASPGYAISPAGGASAGSEAFAWYGQQQRLNYVPPTYYYRTQMVAVPVTYYRPVTVYQPGATVPTTCQRACTGTECQPSRNRLFSWLHGNSCNTGATTCNYGACGTAPAACGTVPYYNTVPAVTAPATIVPTVPGNTIPPRGFNNILTPRTTIPPPGTGVIGVPADSPPVISPGTSIPTNPPAIRTTPGTVVPPAPSSFGTPSGFGSGASTSPPSVTTPAFGSTFRSTTPAKPQAEIQLSRPAISEPGLKRTESTLRPVPDPEAGQRQKPGSRAPALINPNDKTARVPAWQPLGAATYGVVPARWPEKREVSYEVNYKVQPAAHAAHTVETLDDSGWKSAR